MTKSSPNRVHWIQQFIADTPLEKRPTQWWGNPMNPNSLRLNSQGFSWVKKHKKIKYHEIKIQESITPRQLLQLEKLLSAPYFVKSYKDIMVFDESTAVMLHLHAGNLVQYLDNLQQTKD